MSPKSENKLFDTAFSVGEGNGPHYFLKGGRYVEYAFGKDIYIPNNGGHVVGRGTIAELMPNLPAEFQSDLTAAYGANKGLVYLFKGDDYVSYKLRSGDVVVARGSVHADLFPGLDSEFHIGAALHFRNRLTGDAADYIFCGNQYCEVDFRKPGEHQENPYVVKNVRSLWQGLEFTNGFDFTLSTLAPYSYFFRNDKFQVCEPLGASVNPVASPAENFDEATWPGLFSNGGGAPE